jgi:hypothetical protein
MAAGRQGAAGSDSEGEWRSEIPLGILHDSAGLVLRDATPRQQQVGGESRWVLYEHHAFGTRGAVSQEVTRKAMRYMFRICKV